MIDLAHAAPILCRGNRSSGRPPDSGPRRGARVCLTGTVSAARAMAGSRRGRPRCRTSTRQQTPIPAVCTTTTRSPSTPGRHLFNGAPGVVARIVDALALTRGARVLHVGAGLGYYSALLAHVAGPTGRVVAIEIDPALAAAAAANLAPTPWVEVRCGNGFPDPGESFDAILVNAGVTHVHPEWLNAMAPGARVAVPLTATMPGMAPTLGKGVTVLFTRTSGEDLAARVLGFIAIYSGLDLRDDATNARLGQALMRAPWPAFKRLRRDEHPETAQCWHAHAGRPPQHLTNRNPEPGTREPGTRNPEPGTRSLAARHRADDQERLRTGRHRIGQRSVGRLVGQVLLAREEAHERPALLRDVIADRPAQHRVARLERVEHRALRHRAVDVERHLAVARRASVRRCAGSTTRIIARRPAGAWTLRPDGRVCTSTDSTAGRSRTIGAQLSPRVGRRVDLPAGRAEVDAARIERIDRHRVAQHVHVAVAAAAARW